MKYIKTAQPSYLLLSLFCDDQSYKSYPFTKGWMGFTTKFSFLTFNLLELNCCKSAAMLLCWCNIFLLNFKNAFLIYFTEQASLFEKTRKTQERLLLDSQHN